MPTSFSANTGVVSAFELKATTRSKDLMLLRDPTRLAPDDSDAQRAGDNSAMACGIFAENKSYYPTP